MGGAESRCSVTCPAFVHQQEAQVTEDEQPQGPRQSDRLDMLIDNAPTLESVEAGAEVCDSLRRATSIRHDMQELMRLSRQGTSSTNGDLQRKAFDVRQRERELQYVNGEIMRSLTRPSLGRMRSASGSVPMRTFTGSLSASISSKSFTMMGPGVSSHGLGLGASSYGLSPVGENETHEVAQEEEVGDDADFDPMGLVDQAIASAKEELDHDCPFVAEQCLVDAVHKLAPLAPTNERAQAALARLHESEVMQSCHHALDIVDNALELVLAEGWQSVCAKGAAQVWMKKGSDANGPQFRVQVLMDLPLPVAVALNTESEFMQVLNPVISQYETLASGQTTPFRSVKHITAKVPMVGTFDVVQDCHSMSHVNAGFLLCINKDLASLPNGEAMPPAPGGTDDSRIHADTYMVFQPCGESLTKTLMLTTYAFRHALGASNWIITSVAKLMLGSYVPMLTKAGKQHERRIEEKFADNEPFYDALDQLLDVVRQRKLEAPAFGRSSTLYTDSRSPQDLGAAGRNRIQQAREQLQADRSL